MKKTDEQLFQEFKKLITGCALMDDEIEEKDINLIARYAVAGTKLDDGYKMKLFVHAWMDMCGFSAGYRTMIFDTGMFVWERLCLAHEEFRIAKYLSWLTMQPDYDEEKYKDYDISIIDYSEYGGIVASMVDTFDEETFAAICEGFCMMSVHAPEWWWYVECNEEDSKRASDTKEELRQVYADWVKKNYPSEDISKQ